MLRINNTCHFQGGEHTQTYTRIYIYTHIYTYIHTNTQTHTHTHIASYLLSSQKEENSLLDQHKCGRSKSLLLKHYQLVHNYKGKKRKIFPT